jgi:hypothetical protein
VNRKYFRHFPNFTCTFPPVPWCQTCEKVGHILWKDVGFIA